MKMLVQIAEEYISVPFRSKLEKIARQSHKHPETASEQSTDPQARLSSVFEPSQIKSENGPAVDEAEFSRSKRIDTDLFKVPDVAWAKYRNFCDVFIQEIEKLVKVMDNDPFQGTVDFVLTNSPNSTRRYRTDRPLIITCSRCRT